MASLIGQMYNTLLYLKGRLSYKGQMEKQRPTSAEAQGLDSRAAPIGSQSR